MNAGAFGWSWFGFCFFNWLGFWGVGLFFGWVLVFFGFVSLF